MSFLIEAHLQEFVQIAVLSRDSLDVRQNIGWRNECRAEQVRNERLPYRGRRMASVDSIDPE